MNKNIDLLIELAMKRFPKARRIAVENFSSGLTVLDMATSMNLSMDTRLYKWNAQTVAAIKYVINNRKAYNNNVKTV